MLKWVNCIAMILAIVGGVALSDASENPPLNTDLEETVTVVAPGLVRTHLVADSALAGLPQNINVLQIDLRKYRMKMVMAKDQIIGQEATSSMARRYDAIAAVNTGYSFSNNPWNPYHGDPSQFFALDGTVLSEPRTKGRRSLGICTRGDEQTIHVAEVTMRMQVTFGDEARSEVTGLNRKRNDVRGSAPGAVDTVALNHNDLILYTPEWNRSTMTDQSGVEVTVRQDTVSAIHKDVGSNLIPPDGYVLSGSGKYADWLKRHAALGVRVAVDTHVRSRSNPDTPLPLEGCSYTTAGTLLIDDGERFTDYGSENFEPWFYDGRHPRTAIGVSQDGKTIWLVVADGRQPSLGMGMTLDELSDFMAELGAHNAYNLDGGGSSTMVVEGEVVNSFSDVWPGGRRMERRRCDALLLFPR